MNSQAIKKNWKRNGYNDNGKFFFFLLIKNKNFLNHFEAWPIYNAAGIGSGKKGLKKSLISTEIQFFFGLHSRFFIIRFPLVKHLPAIIILKLS